MGICGEGQDAFTEGLGIPTAWARMLAREAFDSAKRGTGTEVELALAFARILDREVQAANQRADEFPPDERGVT